MADLRGKVAIVTGGSRGIGLSVARALAGQGMGVVVAARGAAGLEQARKALAGADAQVRTVACDVRRYEDCRRLVAETIDAFGRLDVLVNNAGIGFFSPVAEIGIEDWQRVIDTNLTGAFYCTREAIPHLRKAGGGWIINIGSLAGRNAFAGGAAYNASKFGLLGFSEAVMQDVRHDDIRVSCIMPGSVATDFEGPGSGRGEDWKLRPEDVAEVVLDLLAYPPRALPSRVELRPARPPRR